MKLETELGIPGLVERFRNYVKLNGANSAPVREVENISMYMAHYYKTVAVPVTKFQGDGKMIHKVRWTGERGFWQRRIPTAEWVWVRRQGRAPAERGKMGELDGLMVARLEGLLRVR